MESNVKSAYFQCFDSSGNLYNNAYVQEDGTVMDSSGNPIPGCTADLTAGIVTDGYGNQIEVDTTIFFDTSTQVAENPDIAAPPSEVEGGEADTVWEGAQADEDEETA